MTRRFYILAGLAAIGTSLYVRNRNKKRLEKEATRSLPNGSRTGDLNRGRLGDNDAYDRISQVSLL